MCLACLVCSFLAAIYTEIQQSLCGERQSAQSKFSPFSLEFNYDIPAYIFLTDKV